MDCIFCKIANKEIDSDIIYEDDKIIAFNDLNPQAPTHFLVIPKKHIASANYIDSSNVDIIAHIMMVIPKLAKELKIDNSGYRIVNNCGKDGGQSVDHIHYHVLAGRQLQWPPG
ncbi:histidine triad nucleotide-binding protein [Miniphocaeibacter halophilus]|uniref:Histidine triad nucleotide-binding protein n=1 Tax=Miniphocaeibacter halophilus TaxID=2931922 RepID=A0AC61MTC7_9FIRM|nr:histidine triad nucleotide-binding protein [Miniphocaeibacter halophilus]QQK07639.1 histidine triad nucleotide-binding protein [Miniphocaeibacter halophilus]